MRKSTFFSAVAGLLLLCASHLSAQGIAKFPEAFKAGSKTAKSSALIPAPDTRDRGIPIYGATLEDSENYRNYVRFWSKDAFEPERLALIDPNDDGWHKVAMRCGAMCGDVYYGYLVNLYTFVEQPKSFNIIDFETGTALEIRNMDNQDDAMTWPTLYEMAYDNTGDKLYALGRSNTGFTSDLYTIDRETGNYTRVAELDYYAWAMTCDYEGNIYTIQGIPDAANEFYTGSQLNKLDAAQGYATVESRHLKNGNEEYIPNYTHSMDMDHHTNQIYWAANNTAGYQTLFKIDPKAGTMENSASLGYNVVVGLYIPFEGADNRDAAGSVTNLTAEADANYTLKATLSWVNPSVNWRGDNLTELKSVQISRGTADNVIATIDANGKVGQGMTYTDEQAEAGYTTYYVTPMRRNGEKGLTEQVKVYVGPDVPGKVVNVDFIPTGDMMTLKWEEPTQGAAGRGYDKTDLCYKVVRQPGNVVIAEDIEARQVEDYLTTAYSAYTYEITPINKVGEGITYTSIPLKFGKAYDVTFEEDLTNEANTLRWTPIDNDQNASTFYYVAFQQMFKNPTQFSRSNDDYLVAPPVNLEGGCTYRITFNTTLGSPDDLYAYSITMGKAATAAAQTEVLGEFTDMNEPGYDTPVTNVVTATPATGGKYFIALHDQSEPGSGFSLGVTGFKVERIYNNDLQAAGLGGDIEMVQGTPANITVKVKNPGSATQNNYKVKVVDVTDGDYTVMGEAQGTQEVKAGETVEVPVSVTPDQAGERMYAGVVEMDTDEYSLNNQSEPAVYKVLAGGSTAWNVYIKDDSSFGYYATLPLAFNATYSTIESIYKNTEVGKSGTIRRMAFEYDSQDITEPTEDVDIRIYMGQTDKNDYPDYPATALKDWTNIDELTLVFDGKQRVEVGENKKMEFNFTTPFEYNSDKNLIVQVWKNGATAQKYPALFHIFNNGSTVPRSLLYSSSKQEFGFATGSNFYAYYEIPLLHLAIEYTDGITNETVVGGESMYYNANSLHLGFAARSANIYSIDGKLVARHLLNGQNTVATHLNAGVYVVKAVAQNGTAKTQKIVVAQ